MKNIYYFGDHPKYDGHYYNNEKQIGLLIKYLEKPENSPKFLYTTSQDTFRRAIQQAMLIYSELSPIQIYYAWIDVYNEMDLAFIEKRLYDILIKMHLHEIDTSEAEAEQSHFLDLMYPNNGSLFDNIQLLIRKLINVHVVILLNVRKGELPFAIQSRIHEILNMTSTSKIQILITTSTDNASANTICFKNTESININTHGGNNENRTHIINDKDITSLILLNHPVNKRALDYIQTFSHDAHEKIIQGQKEEILYQLRNHGINFEKNIYEVIESLRVHDVYQQNAVNSMLALSFDSPERFINEYKDSINYDNFNDGISIVTLSSSLAMAKYNHDYADCNKLSSILSEKIANRKNTILFENELQIKSIVNYLSQMILLMDFDKKMFGVLEKMVYALSEFILEKNDGNINNNYEASRWIYKLGYIYDRKENHNRQTDIGALNFIYEKSALLLRDYDKLNDTLDFQSYAYRYANSLYYSNNKQKSHDVFSHAAKTLFQMSKRNSTVESNRYRKSAHELILACLDKSHDSNEILHDMIVFTAMPYNLNQFIEYYQKNEFPTTYYPNKFLSDTYVLIIYITPDINVAHEIASYLFMHHNISSKLYFFKNIADAECEMINKNVERIIILGAPDSPGDISLLIKKYDPSLENIYYLKMGEDFSMPSIVETSFGKILVILCASGIGGISQAWVQAVIKLEKKKIPFQTRELEMMLDVLAQFGFGFIGKVGETFAGELINVVKSRFTSISSTRIADKVLNQIPQGASKKEITDILQLDNRTQDVKADFSRLMTPKESIVILLEALTPYNQVLQPEEVINITFAIQNYLMEAKRHNCNNNIIQHVDFELSRIAKLYDDAGKYKLTNDHGVQVAQMNLLVLKTDLLESLNAINDNILKESDN